MAIAFLPNRTQDCITACWECRTHCQKMLFHYCLEQGGQHVSAGHVKIMTDCMEICQTAADFMVRGSDMVQSICSACADICFACAESCESIGDEDMDECAQLCRECAEMCDNMSLSGNVMEAAGDASETNINLI